MHGAHIARTAFVMLLGFLVTYLLTPLVARLAPRLGMIDQPGGPRRIHRRPTPRGGGIAIVAAFHLAYLTTWFLGWTQAVEFLDLRWWRAFAIASSILVAVGLADDRGGLNPWLKLSGQCLAAVALYAMGVRFGSLLYYQLPPLLDFGLTVFWYVALTNAFNLIDGMDGLATGLALVSLVGLVGSLVFRRYTEDARVLLALAGACLAFLRYNFYPARIFLGDTGSMFLGFALAAAAVATSSKGSLTATLGVPLLAVGLPLFDTVLSVWRRSLRVLFPRAFPEQAGARGIMRPDAEHLHHRFLRLGLGQQRVALLLYLLSLALVAVGMLSLFLSARQVGLYLLAFVVGVYIVVRHLAQVELWDTGRAIIRGLHRPREPAVVFILYPLWDAFCLSLALLVSMWLTQCLCGERRLWDAYMRHLPAWIGPVFLCLALGRVYTRVWSRARFSDFLYLSVALLGGVAASLGLHGLQRGELTELHLNHTVVYGSLAYLLLVGSRMSLRGVQDLMALAALQRRFNRTREPRRLLLYGAGGRCMLFLREQGFRLEQHEQPQVVVGLVDDDVNLRSRRVCGYRVLGTGAQLPELIRRHHIDKVVVTAVFPDQAVQSLAQRLKGSGVALSRWAPTETEILPAPGPDAQNSSSDASPDPSGEGATAGAGPSCSNGSAA